MGKPFVSELEKVHQTLDWSLNQDVNHLRCELLLNKENPLYIVGSGGSLSACYFAAYLYQQHGMLAKAVTPIELLYNKDSIRNANILFISASGKNSDIIFAFKTAIRSEARKILSICMRKNSPLVALSEQQSNTYCLELDLPTGKDGFLATNSLVGFFGILYKSLSNQVEPYKFDMAGYKISLDKFLSLVDKDFTFTILYGKEGHSVAIDIESKIAEAALGDVLVSDIRNFGHGRHHWFDKRKNNSAIVSLISPYDELLFEKTLNLLPYEIPMLKIQSNFDGGLAALDLLIKSFHFISELGKMQNIDPGKPGVPEFGGKLYRLKYESLYERSKHKKSDIIEFAICRKTNVSKIDLLENNVFQYWEKGLKNFVSDLQNTTFGSIIFDYDGTLCSAKNRYSGFDDEISEAITKALENNIIIGIATGRGKSVREALQKIIPIKYWKNVIVGYYNGSQISLLSDDSSPKTSDTSFDPMLESVHGILTSINYPVELNIELRPDQIVIEAQDSTLWRLVKNIIIQKVVNIGLDNISVLESTHSIDIINSKRTSKLNILPVCQNLAKEIGLSTESLTIGDKGAWPGNDYQLLSTKYSLSVDEVSSMKDSCWNLSLPGLRNTDATKFYLSRLIYNKSGFTINIL